MHLDYFNWLQLCSTCAIFCTILHMLKNIQKWSNYEINYSGVNDTVSLYQGNRWDFQRKTGNFGRITANFFGELSTFLFNRSPICQTCNQQIPISLTNIDVTENCMIILRFDHDDFIFDRNHKILLKKFLCIWIVYWNLE